MKIKNWLLTKVQNEAKGYNMWINVEYGEDDYLNENGTKVLIDEEGYATVQVDEIIKETPKAVRVRLATGAVDGSGKGWCTWLPKSQIRM